MAPPVDIPPWAEPPKTIVYQDESLREKLNEKLVYQAYVTDRDWRARKFYPGNKLILKLKDEVIGEGQIVLVEAGPMGRLTRHDATVSGYKEVEDLVKALLKELPTAKKWEDTEIYRILYRWL
ncbi:MAG TPA: hypothetical protein VJ400_03335 [Thermoplasmata archaeon]|nr:hypothetical protein [Thermoplasmata archaeon]